MQDVAEQDIEPVLSTVFARYKGEPSELIPILQDVQDNIGYIPPGAITGTAKFLNIPESTAYGVLTFYTQFCLTPPGKHIIKVCLGTACHVRGAGEIVKAIENKFGIKPGETTDDFEFSLDKVACFGSCALAPVMVVDDTVYGNVTPEKAMEILEKIT